MQLTLLHAGLAAGAALAAVPVVLHLILRQRPKHVVFPALRFIQVRHRANRRRLRLRHLLLLALRMLVVALMALALARPRVGGIAAAQQEAPVAAVFLFDTSLSMQYRYENVTRLEKAQQLAQELLKRLPEDSKVSVMESRLHLAESPAAEAGSASGTPELLRMWTTDPVTARDRIQALQPDPVSRPMPRALAEALERLADPSLEEKRHELYVFSDMATSSWPRQESLAAVVEKLPDLAVYVLDVGVESPKNVGIATLAPSQQVLLPGVPASLRADIQASTEPGQRVIELYLGEDETGSLRKRDQQLVDLTPGTTREVLFALPSLPEGIHQGKVQLLGGGDGLPFDDVRYLTLEVRPALKVLMVGSRSDTEHWRLALAPSGPERLQENPYRVDRVDTQDVKPASLSSYAVVCLVDAPGLVPQLWDALHSYAMQGGGVAILPGPRAEPANYNSEAAQLLMPARLLDAKSVDPPVHLNPVTFGHPLLAPFRQWEMSWQAKPVLRYFTVQAQADASVVIPYSDAAPALLERAVGRGRVALLTTPVSYRPGRAWNFLPSSGPGAWMFLALADQMTQYLAGNAEERLNYEAGEATVRLRLLGDAHPGGYLVRTPSGQQRLERLDRAATELVLAIPGELGNYQVRAGSAAEPPAKGFSVNAPGSESQLERLAAPDLDAVLGKERYRKANDLESLNIELRQTREGTEIFPLLIGLMVLLLAGEAYAAGRFYPAAEGEEPANPRWERLGQAVVTVLGMALGLFACTWATVSLVRAAGPSDRPVPWLDRLSELALGVLVLAIAVGLGWRWLRESTDTLWLRIRNAGTP